MKLWIVIVSMEEVTLEKGFWKRDYFRGRVEFFYGHEIIFFLDYNVLHNQSNKKKY